MRIYKIAIEHMTYGMNWSSEKVAARTFKEAVKQATKMLGPREKIESVELLESTEP